MAKAINDQLLAALRDAGLCDDTTVRVVIDINAGELPAVHIEKIADARGLLSVVTALGGTQIKREK